MKVRSILLFLILGICEITPDAVRAQENKKTAGIWERDRLTGNWAGIRSMLESGGLIAEMNAISDVTGTIKGGLSRDEVIIFNFDLRLLLDFEKLTGFTGSSILVSGLYNNGKSISRITGDLQGVNNIEAVNTFRLFEAWFQQRFWDNRFSILAGIYDLNTEFDFMESSALFVQSSQGLGGDFAASGFVGPPTFPAAGLGSRIKFLPVSQVYVQAGFFDGIPAWTESLHKPDFTLSSEDGILTVVETGFLLFSSEEFLPGLQTRRQRRHVGRATEAGYQLKAALGVWAYSKNYHAMLYGSMPQELQTNKKESGVYLLTDWKWRFDSMRSYRRLSLFTRLGFTDTDVSIFDGYVGGGITLKGLFSGDPNGLFGFSVAHVKTSSLTKSLDPSLQSHETAFEWTYLTKVIPWLNIQPDVQYVVNPGTNPSLDNAWIIALRTDITF